jgi:hypothetical protein
VKTNWWKRGFETALWNSRLVVLVAVVTSVLAVEIFKDAYDIKAHSTLDLLYIAAAIALIGLALYLTHSSGPEKKTGPQEGDAPSDN